MFTYIKKSRRAKMNCDIYSAIKLNEKKLINEKPHSIYTEYGVRNKENNPFHLLAWIVVFVDIVVVVIARG